MTDLETCSWCTAEVPYTSLRAAHDGAMVCRLCKRAEDQTYVIDILSGLSR